MACVDEPTGQGDSATMVPAHPTPAASWLLATYSHLGPVRTAGCCPRIAEKLRLTWTHGAARAARARTSSVGCRGPPRRPQQRESGPRTPGLTAQSPRVQVQEPQVPTGTAGGVSSGHRGPHSWGAGGWGGRGRGDPSPRAESCSGARPPCQPTTGARSPRGESGGGAGSLLGLDDSRGRRLATCSHVNVILSSRAKSATRRQLIFNCFQIRILITTRV